MMQHLRHSPNLPHSVALVAGVMILAACGPVQVDLRGLDRSNTDAMATMTYVVRAGDTLGGIALAFGTSVEDLIALNARQYPRLAESQGRVIMPGWELMVPRTVTRLAIATQSTNGVADAIRAQAPMPSVEADEGYFEYDAALEIVRLTNDERGRNKLPLLNIDEG